LATLDLATANGRGIPIEERPAEEVTVVRGKPIAPKNTVARHPAFDVTPADLVTAIVTDKGVVRAPYSESIRTLFESRQALVS
jgi:methylthioribose-1-phosphate isomerase